MPYLRLFSTVPLSRQDNLLTVPILLLVKRTDLGE